MLTFRPVAAALLATSLSSPLFAAKHDAWVEVRSPNFTVVSNAGEKQARKCALQFEQIRAVFRHSLEVARTYPSPIVTVLAVKDEASMRELLPEYWAKGRAHPAGIFATRFNLYYAAVELDAHGNNPYATLYHEYYHAITTPYFPDLPVWLSEGLAEYYGSTQIEDKYVMLGRDDQDLVRRLWDSPFIPLNVLLNVDHSSPYYNEGNKTTTFYAESWALTHYLMIGDHGAHKPMLIAYLDALNHGKTQDEAAMAFGDLRQLQSNVETYVHQTAFLYSKLPTPAIDDNELRVRALSDAEADTYRAGFAVVRNRIDDAKPMLAEALKLDPNVALAYQYLSLTQFLAEQREQALESASRAISLDPKNSFTRYLRAFLATTGGGMKQEDSQIEEDLRQAITLSPDFAPPYSLLAMYLATVDRNLAEALSLAQKAVSFEPGNSRYQLALGQVLVRMNKLDEADLAAARARAWARDAEEKINAANFTNFLQEVHEYQNQMSAGTLSQTETTTVQVTHPSGSNQNKSADSKGSAETEITNIPNVATTASTPRVRVPTTVQMQISISILSDALGFDFNPYLKNIMDAIRNSLATSASQVPLPRQRSLSLEFSILKDGTIAGLKVSSTSGDVALDQASRNGVAECSPLPGLPRGFKGQSLSLHFGLTYSPELSQ